MRIPSVLALQALHGFVKHMPWDCVRFSVGEETVLLDQRIMAFKTPNGTLTGAGGPQHAYTTPPNQWGVVATNRGPDEFTYQLSFDDGQPHTLQRHRYGPGQIDVPAGTVLVPADGYVNVTLPSTTAEFWLEYA